MHSTQQMHEIIGSVYADAYLRIQYLENENKILREDQQRVVESAMKVQEELREEIKSLQEEVDGLRLWNTGKENSTFPESSRRKQESKSVTRSYTSLLQRENKSTLPVKSTETPEEMENLMEPPEKTN